MIFFVSRLSKNKFVKKKIAAQKLKTFELIFSKNIKLK